MKKIAVVFGMLAMSSSAFAVETLNINQTIALDVLGQNPMELDATMVGQIKEIVIQNEYSGFECFVSQVQSKKTHSDDKLIVSVSWTPGADSSGCEVKVVGTNGKASAALYMNY